MTRNCDYCGQPYQAQRPTSKFCSSTCRGKNSRGDRRPPDAPTPITTSADATDLVGAVVAELTAADRQNSALGLTVIALARRLDSATTGAGLAALSKELRGALAEALQNAAVAADPLDELQVKRDAKRRRAAG